MALQNDSVKVQSVNMCLEMRDLKLTLVLFNLYLPLLMSSEYAFSPLSGFTLIFILIASVSF